ncbi:MAG: hypothetical protein HDR77_02535 [Bacteroides sp.]|nr:hypothetical protein [Bacteroides sp.]
MTKDQQDLAWQCLPKEARDDIKSQYNQLSHNPQIDKYDSVYLSAFENIFGHHNLTSATEPEEMLMVKREIIQEAYKHHLKYAKDDSDDQWHWGIIFILSGLFGDKCLPDKPNTPNSGELKPQMAENKPKFKVGDKVVICSKPYDTKWDGIVKTIKSVELNEDGEFVYSFYDYNDNVVEDTFPHLSPYTEENKEPIVSSHDTMGDTKETMEVKDLNLCELLKGCEGEEFYSLMHGKVRFMTIGADGFVMFDLPESFSVYDNGKYDLNAEVIIYPSRALYEKYPLDAKKAWDEWANERKPKRWTPQIGERFFFVNAAGTVSQDFCRSEIESNGMQLKRRAIGNEFQTGKDAEAFAKIFREALTKFHEENNE